MVISVKVKTGSGKSEVQKIGESDYLVSIKERPIKGKANQEVIRLIASHFKVSTREIKIISGKTVSKKLIKIQGDE